MKFYIKIDFKAYKNLVFYQYYSKPNNILLTIFGLMLFCISLLSLFGLIKSHYSPYVQLAVGVFILFIIPIILNSVAWKNYKNHKVLNSYVDFEFINSQMNMVGENFTFNVDLNQALKIIETKNWFIIYETKQFSYLLCKQAINSMQQQELRSFFRELTGVKLKLKDQ